MPHEISTLTLYRVGSGPEDRDIPHYPGEIRALVNGRDVVEDVFPEGITAHWEWQGLGIPLAASESSRRVELAVAECTSMCCGAVSVAIRRDGAHVLWSDWENTGDDGECPPDLRFDGAQYDAEVARASAAWG